MKDAVEQWAREKGFADVRVTDIRPMDGFAQLAKKRNPHLKPTEDPRDLMPEAKSVLLLVYPFVRFTGYPEGTGQISPYYYASHRSHGAAAELADEMRKAGLAALHTHALPAKAFAARAGLGFYGRNCLIQHPDFGSQIVLQMILADQGWGERGEGEIEKLSPACEKCGACVRACPTGALDGQTALNLDRCIRAHMLWGTPVPEALREPMGQRILGCDVCRSVCPQNRDVPSELPRAWSEPFRLERLLGEEAEALEAVAEIKPLLGANLARLHNLRTQALLAAGNSGDTRWIPRLRAFAESEHEGERAHALWALSRLAEST